MYKSPLYMSLLLVFSALSGKSIAAPQDYWPQRAVMFHSSSEPESYVRYAQRRLGPNVPLDIYNVDEGAKLMQSWSDSFPKEILKADQQTIDQYVKENIAPLMRENTDILMRSKLGVSIAKMYGVERIPAIVFDGQYLVYGLQMGEAIKKYQFFKDRESDHE